MVFNFLDVMPTLADMGFFSFVLPWLLFVIILDAILVNVGKPMGLDKQKSVIVAAIISFFVVNFVPAGMDLGVYLTKFFGTASMYITALLVVVLFLGMGGMKLEELPGGKTVYGIVLLLIAVVIFNGIGGIPYVDLSTENVTILFVIALIVGVVWVLGSKEKGGDEHKATPQH